MARAGITLEVVASHPDGWEVTATGAHKQQLSVSDITNSASTGDDEFGVGGAWQQTQFSGEGQAGPCGVWHTVDVSELSASELRERGQV